jgi:hypothetical protein
MAQFWKWRGGGMEEIAFKINAEFNPFSGWINIKKNLDFSINKESGELESGNPKEAVAWKETILPSLPSKYAPKGIFKAAECCLFYNMLPDSAYSFKRESCEGMKVNKVKITVPVCENIYSSENLSLLVVGKSEQPQCFKNVKSLPYTYKHNKSGRMTCEIFQEGMLA